MRFIVFGIVCLFLSGLLRAEEALPLVQRELRARKFYFGEIHGRATDETVVAIRKFKEARGIDSSTGNLDDDTLRALGLPAIDGHQDEARVLGECCTFVLRYLQAWQSGDWEYEGPFFAAEVNYYGEGNMNRASIREMRARDKGNWPQRKFTLLQRIASLIPERGAQAQVTARVRTEATNRSGHVKVLTEDLIFRLQKTDAGWRIAALKQLD